MGLVTRLRRLHAHPPYLKPGRRQIERRTVNAEIESLNGKESKKGLRP